MGKVQRSIACQYCGKAFSTTKSLESHWSQKRDCARKRQVDLNQFNHALALLTHSPDDITPAPNLAPDLPIPTVVQNENLADVEMTDGERMGPSSRVTLEEIEDQDASHQPQWGPHPFARPTPRSIFVEPHPESTAGAATSWQPISENTPPLFNSVLEDPEVFEEAHWLANLPISDEQRDKFFRLPRSRGGPWKNVEQFNRDIDNLPHGPEWHRQTIRVEGENGDEILDLWLRDVVEVVRELIKDRRFLEYMRFAPEKHWETIERKIRIYDEMWSGDWWWKIQNLLGEYATVVPLILATDKTQMTILSGNKRAWPVYLTIGNISKEIRRRPSQRAMVLIGYLPVSSLTCFPKGTARSEAGWQVFHTCMSRILAPLKEISRTGEDMLCADGGIRRCHPILASYIADFPEQCTVTCTRENRCPICWVPELERGDYSKRYPLRDRQRTLDALQDHRKGYLQTAKTLGIRPTVPFWADLPFVDISSCITPDLLHQMNKGVFDHVVDWCTGILGESEVDRRLSGLPRFQGMRHFAKGISVVSQWMGNEARALAKTFVPAIVGCNPKAVSAARSIVDFMYGAHMPELSDTDLEMMEANLAKFHNLKPIFIQTGQLADEESFSGIPKIHMMSHYVRSIRELGTTDGYNTEATERLHIDYVKEAWRASNHVNAIGQMATYLQRKESWAMLRAHLRERGLLPDSLHQLDEVGENLDGDEVEVVAGTGIKDGEAEAEEVAAAIETEVWYPNPTITIAKRANPGKKTGAYLVNQHQALDLITATRRFVSQLPNAPSSFPLSEDSIFKVWSRCRMTHGRLPFLLSAPPQKDQIRAFPGSHDDEGRMTRFGAFDVVLFSPPNASTSHRQLDAHGLNRFQAGRIRAIFQLPHHLESVCSDKLVYLEQFRPFSNSAPEPALLHTTSHMMLDNKRHSLVVPLSSLRMACHLVPRYSLLDVDRPISSTSDLLSIHDEFFFNKYCSHFVFVVMEHWRKKRLGSR